MFPDECLLVMFPRCHSKLMSARHHSYKSQVLLIGGFSCKLGTPSEDTDGGVNKAPIPCTANPSASGTITKYYVIVKVFIF